MRRAAEGARCSPLATLSARAIGVVAHRAPICLAWFVLLRAIVPSTLNRIARLGVGLALIASCAAACDSLADSRAASIDSTDAGVDATEAAVADQNAEAKGCDPSCHWDCMGGASCTNGKVWMNGYGTRPCCGFGAWDPDSGSPPCGVWSFQCASGMCGTPDPRYAACLSGLGAKSACQNVSQCEHITLSCAEGLPKAIGEACDGDEDCRPAADGISRLRCDKTLQPPACVEDSRPPAPGNYGADCGFTLLAQPNGWSLTGEMAVNSGACGGLCQVLKTDKCILQGCTVPCVFDEDCPEGSVCLCGSYGSASAYCAAATDRNTAAGRAAGLTVCL